MSNSAQNIHIEEKASFQFPFDMDIIWRIVPILMAIAAFFPAVSNAISDANQSVVNIEIPRKIGGAFISTFIFNKVGDVGLKIFAILPALLAGYGVYKLARNLNAKVWAASLGASFYIVAHVFGISPPFSLNIDDGLFAAFCINAAANMVKSIKNESQFAMGLAFFFTILATIMRPYAAWPQFAIYFGIVFSTRNFAERPFFALLSALCWGPGLFLANWFAKTYNANINNDGSVVAGFLKALDFSPLFNSNLAKNIPHLGDFLLSTIFAIILAGVAIFAIIAQISKHKTSIIIGFCVFLTFALFAAIGYGDINAARFLLDGLFIAAISTLSNLKIPFSRPQTNSR